MRWLQVALWLTALVIWTHNCAVAYYQSRDSNYNVKITAGGPSLSLSGPSSGTVSVASTNFTMTLSGTTFSGSQTVTIADGSQGGLFTPSVGGTGTSTVTVTPAASATSFTFTYTPAVTGALTLTTTNAQSWVNPAPATYTSNSAGYTGPADIVASPLLFYGLRAMSAAYASSNGLMINITRASDSHNCDVLAASTGGMGNTANCGTGGDNGQTAASFCSATTCKVANFYDQSGNGYNVGQSTTAAQPGLNFSCLGSLPCINFNTVGMVLSRSSSPTQIQPVIYSAVWNNVSAASAPVFVSDSASNYIAFYMYSSTLYMALEANASTSGKTVTSAYTLNAAHITQAIFNGTSSVLNFDGSGLTLTGTVGTNGMANNLYMGNDSFGTNWVGKIFEVGVWPGPAWTTTQQTNMCHNQYTYWGTATSC